MFELFEFDDFVCVVVQVGIFNLFSELYGVICGLLVIGYGYEDNILFGILVVYVEQFDGLLLELMCGLVDWCDQILEGFFGIGLELLLLLFLDEDDLDLCVVVLVQWSEGFLVGFGIGVVGVVDIELLFGVQEVLFDLFVISQVIMLEEIGEEEEQMFEQVVEYCCMFVLMIYIDLVMKQQVVKQFGFGDVGELEMLFIWY